MWGIPAAARQAIGEALEQKFEFLLSRLGVAGTRALAEKHAPFVPGSYPSPGSGVPALKVQEDVTGLSD